LALARRYPKNSDITGMNIDRSTRKWDSIRILIAYMPRPPRLLYIVTEDWYFLSHRLPMARAARDAGFEVHVATNVQNGAEAIRREGFVLHPVSFIRGGLDPVGMIAGLRALRRLHRLVRPDIVHRVALQVIVMDALATIGMPTPSVNAIAGLGYTFITDTRKANVLRALIGAIFRLVAYRENGVILVQNPDDQKLVASLGVPTSRIALIPGSGVDVIALQPTPEPQEPPVIGFVGRLIDIKGIRTLVAAHRLLRNDGIGTELLIAGAPDPANPSSVSREEAEEWGREPGIKWLGHVSDIATVWAQAHIAALPSHGGEGVPKSLLEAAACGRPLIATDVPGCREIVIPGDTGILVPVDDAPALAAAVKKLSQSAELRVRLGRGARRLAEARFSALAVGRATVDLYRQLADKAG
jgi:glycosyltransferase involved in cell wall biosynthesis